MAEKTLGERIRGVGFALSQLYLIGRLIIVPPFVDLLTQKHTAKGHSSIDVLLPKRDTIGEGGEGYDPVDISPDDYLKQSSFLCQKNGHFRQETEKLYAEYQPILDDIAEHTG